MEPSSSSCSLSSSSSVSPSTTCQICLLPAHGHHFGAFTCRACAAFFRRCHFSKEIFQCRFPQRKCKPDWSSHHKWTCKKCRLDKCLAEGMTAQNIQYDRDAFSSSESYLKNRQLTTVLSNRVPTTVEKLLGAPHMVLFLRKELPTNKSVMYLDMSELVEQASRVLRTIPEDLEKRGRLSNLEQLELGLRDFRAAQMEHLSDGSSITMECAVNSWEHSICSVARWLNFSELISHLPHSIKYELLRCSWLVWGKLERMAMTAQMRVNRMCGKRQFVTSHTSLIDFDRMTADISFWSNYTFEELGFLFSPTDVFFDGLIWQVVETRPDPIELTYLLCSLCFGLTGKSLQGEVETTTDQIMEQLSNDLHEYYVGKLKKPAYALRLKQLLKINERFLKLRASRCERYSVCSSLDIFRAHFSNLEFFTVGC